MTKAETQRQQRAYIANMLETNPVAIDRAIVAIYKRQTSDEQVSHATSHSNGIGFTGFDAEYMSNLAQFAIRTGFLTPKQRGAVKERLKKYWRQLCEVAEQSNHPKYPFH